MARAMVARPLAVASDPSGTSDDQAEAPDARPSRPPRGGFSGNRNSSRKTNGPSGPVTSSTKRAASGKANAASLAAVSGDRLGAIEAMYASRSSGASAAMTPTCCSKYGCQAPGVTPNSIAWKNGTNPATRSAPSDGELAGVAIVQERSRLEAKPQGAPPAKGD